MGADEAWRTMVEDESLVAPRGPPRLDPDVRLIGTGRRRGDGLVHDVWVGLRQGRLREYAPPGAAIRDKDGRLTCRDEHRRAWLQGCVLFQEQAQRLYAAAPACVPRIWRVSEETGGAWLIAAPGGEPLSEALARGLAMPPDAVMRFARDLADALAAIHGLGLTHLDICTETVSIMSGQIMLGDFAVDERPFLHLLGREEGLVRPGYSPIEMYDGDISEPLGPAADIYAASALVYRLMTGAEPPRWQDRWRDGGSLLPSAPAGYPPAFVEAIRRGLAIEPHHRHQDARAWKQAMGVPPAPSNPTPPHPEPARPETDEPPWPDPAVPAVWPPASTRRAGWLVVAIIGLLGLAVLVGAYLLLRPPAEASEAAAAAYAVTGPANVRAAANPTAAIVARLRAGERVTGVMTNAESGERWLRITEGPHSGAFVWAGNLSSASAAPPSRTMASARRQW